MPGNSGTRECAVAGFGPPAVTRKTGRCISRRCFGVGP